MCTPEEYRVIVDRCASERKNLQIANGKPENARYLIKKLFSVAVNHVRLYSGKLAMVTPSDNGVQIYAWDELVEEIAHFLSLKNTKLEILLQHDLDGGPNHPVLNMLKLKGMQGDLIIKQVETDDDFAAASLHFMTIDNEAYRLETDDSNTKAYANFWDKNLTNRLSRVFDDAFSRAKPLSFA